MLTFFTVFLGLCSVDAVAQQQQEIKPVPADTTTSDSLSVRADSLSLSDSLRRVMPYKKVQGELITSPFRRRLPKLYYIQSEGDKVTVKRDTVFEGYTVERTINGVKTGIDRRLSFDEYAEMSKRNNIRSNWEKLTDEFSRKQEKQRGLLDFKFNIPGGRQSAFTTIFGKPQVNLKVNGTANLNLGASIQKTDNPSLPPDQQTQINPTFNQNLKLNIQGSIGDKLTINTDWDTERAFDFQNRLNIVYQGYEDEIIKRIEMGNVSMETGNNLIQGGGALFGVKSIAEMGPLRITSVVSQQEGQGNSQTITGGSQEETINLHPADYEDDRNFFLDFFTRQQFEDNMSNPQQLGTALDLVEVNVWVLNASTQDIEGQRPAIAMVDLGVVEQNGQYLPPDEDQDRFTDDAKLDSLRDPTIGVSAADFGVSPSEFVEGRFVPLVEGVDYELNRPLGFLTLKRNLDSRQALAISFSYRNPRTGQVTTVGDINQGGENRIYLKLLRPQNMTTDNKAWPLTMRNVYSLGVSDLKQENLELDVQFSEVGSNVPQSSLPGRNTYLLQDLGLDRVDTQGAIGTDNQIDFGTGTLDPRNGRIIFPYLQPFGDRVKKLLQQAGQDQETINQYSFNTLYTEKQRIASQDSKNQYFTIDGTAKGGVSDNYYLGLALVEGSVHVYANGVELQEGSDYTVDYSIGSITILNKKYLQSGQEIKIDYESNQLMQIEQKTFTGVRAEYNLSEDLKFGGTFFKLKERPLQDKIRIGDEPINNAVVGLDAKANFDVPWLTRAIDNMPLLQTKEPSNISFTGEWAQLRPGVAQTNAVSEAIKQNKLFKDEENGVSFIDDFEGVETNISFLSPGRWNLAAAPAAIPGYAPDEPFFGNDPPTSPTTTLDDKIARSDLRGQFSWYSIPRNISGIIGNAPDTPESRLVKVTDVFPGKKDYQTQDQYITTLDVFYDPTNRGPYNYNKNLKQVTEQEPERMWGGMTAVLPSGLEDLTQNNIEFIEFWVQSILPKGREPTPSDLQDYNGNMYIDVGVISEDVVPNFRMNSEDGLVENPNNLVVDQRGRSYLPSTNPLTDGQFSNETRAQEDVGLDGAPNTGGVGNRNERVLFDDFLQAMREAYGPESEKYQEIAADPSNDDYFYFGQSEMDGLPKQARFYRMHGYHEGNTPQSGGDKRAVTNQPDTEGLVTASIVERNNSYYEYQVDWNPADVNNLNIGSPGTYIVDKVTNGPNQSDKWYQVRIPLEDIMRKIGDIDNFQNIAYIRIWLSGYKKPFTLRFAKLQLVGSQWKKADDINQQQATNADFRISSINVEENGTRQPIPYRQPTGAIRAVNRGQQQNTLANEQSIVMQTRNLGPSDLKMIKKVYPGGLNLINYSNLRMFVHGEGYRNRKDMQLVVRLGKDLQNNYYEYRQPVTPTDSTYNFTNGIPSDETVYEQEADKIWLPEENGMNIVLSKFNQLKQLRDQEGRPITEEYVRSDILKEAPPGASIAIKGNPSLDGITEIGMGIRNPFEVDTTATNNGTASLTGQLWLNELRVSGFDNKKGWAANAKATFKLADFARINTNLSRQTDGFGGLADGLGERRYSDELSYDINSTFNLHKFIPSRFGWNIPVSLSYRRSTVTPRYLPNQGDIRLSEYKDAVNARNDIGSSQKDSLISSKVTESQNFSEQYSINISNVSKKYSKNFIGKTFLDKTNYNYVYNQNYNHSPQYQYDDNWNYNTSINYNYSFRNVRMVQPLGFLGSVPILSSVAGLRLGYMPSSINASANMSRKYTEKKKRPVQVNDSTLKILPIQQSHTFKYGTNFGLSYNLTPSISTSFQSATNFDLSNEGTEFLRKNGKIDSTRYRVRPTFDVLRDVMFDSVSARRNNYNESYSASWRPNVRRVDFLRWLSYSTSYKGGFQWNNGPRGSQQGASVSNNFNLQQTLTLDTQDLLGRIPGFDKLSENGNSRGGRRRGRSDNGNGQEGEQGQEEGGNPVIETAGKIGKKILLAGLSMQSVDVSYQKNRTSRQDGYAGSAPFYNMFNQQGESFSPPFSYRAGLTEDIGRDNLIKREGAAATVRLGSQHSYSDNVSVSTRLSPFNNLTIDLNWSTQWSKTSTQQDINSVLNQSGNINTSVWAFGAGYSDLFKKQLGTAFDDMGAEGNVISDSTGNGDGRTVLNRVTLQEDFRNAYLGGGKVIGSHNFTPFPKPNWKITWSGLEKVIPFIKNYLSRATLTHSYNGSYRVGWTYNPVAGQLQPNTIGSYSVRDKRPEYEPTTINVAKKFNPLLGLNLTWESNLRTQLEYTYSEITSLALSNTTVTENLSRGVSFSLNYTIRGFTLPFFKKIENAVDFTISGSYMEDTEQKFLLGNDLGNALSEPAQTIVRDPNQYDFSPQSPTGQTRVKASTIIGYQFSKTIKANFEYNFNKLMPKSSRVYPRTDHDIRFNIIVSIRSN